MNYITQLRNELRTAEHDLATAREDMRAMERRLEDAEDRVRDYAAVIGAMRHQAQQMCEATGGSDKPTAIARYIEAHCAALAEVDTAHVRIT